MIRRRWAKRVRRAKKLRETRRRKMMMKWSGDLRVDRLVDFAYVLLDRREDCRDGGDDDDGGRVGRDDDGDDATSMLMRPHFPSSPSAVFSSAELSLLLLLFLLLLLGNFNRIIINTRYVQPLEYPFLTSLIV